MNRFTVLEKMRESYRQGDVKALKRQLAISKWFLTPEDEQKILAAILKLEQRPPNAAVALALKLMGGKIV